MLFVKFNLFVLATAAYAAALPTGPSGPPPPGLPNAVARGELSPTCTVGSLTCCRSASESTAVIQKLLHAGGVNSKTFIGPFVGDGCRLLDANGKDCENDLQSLCCEEVDESGTGSNCAKLPSA
ncbi:hypothetical protein HYDPIDRAFT_107993 [Hydnomerulius pinastri MD-312]|nr:hypothetical protein HYDPIDRAFT_107993 [Hydnomerulius pinastri MD-312]